MPKDKTKKLKSTTACGVHYSTRNFCNGFRERLHALQGEDETLESVHNRVVEAGLELMEKAPVKKEKAKRVFTIPEFVEEFGAREELGADYEFLRVNV